MKIRKHDPNKERSQFKDKGCNEFTSIQKSLNNATQVEKEWIEKETITKEGEERDKKHLLEIKEELSALKNQGYIKYDFNNSGARIYAYKSSIITVQNIMTKVLFKNNIKQHELEIINLYDSYYLCYFSVIRDFFSKENAEKGLDLILEYLEIEYAKNNT